MKLFQKGWAVCCILLIGIFLGGCNSNNRDYQTFAGVRHTNSPAAAIIVSPPNDISVTEGDAVSFLGLSSDAENGDMAATSQIWISNIDGLIGTGISFSLSTLSVGRHVITLTVTDTLGGSDSSSIVVNVVSPVNTTPVAAITGPLNGSHYSSGATIHFAGSGTDAEDGALVGSSLVWSSNLDGQIGTGTAFDASALSVGSHMITLAVKDQEGATGTATVAITIEEATTENTAPVATIFSPASGGAFTSGDTINFSGSGTDVEDGLLSDTLLGWTSSVDGSIGNGASFDSSSLSVGNHTITLTVTDSAGATDTATVDITIEEAIPENAAPVAVISSPAGESYTYGDTITFSGTGTDAEDGALTATSLVWTSNIDGQIGTGISFESATLSIGTHSITLTATDSEGATGVANVSLTVSSHLPVVTIESPAGGTYTYGQLLTFKGSATDVEDGELSGGSLVWTSNRDGQIGTGATFTSAALSIGDHTITLTATDSDQASATATLSITIPNTLPEATITSPTSGTYIYGNVVHFDGSGTDVEDGTLSGNSLVWTSSIDGTLGTGTSIETDSLSVGSHTITLAVSDNNGGRVTETVNITIQEADDYTNSLGMAFRHLKAGTFTMGSPRGEYGRENNEKQHKVTLSADFYMMTTEVTQAQWSEVMGSNPAYHSNCGDCPVENVSWDEVQTFIVEINQRGEGNYRLPTEAEWEYAARAGSTAAFANGDISELGCDVDPNLDQLGWYCYNSGYFTHTVALKEPNDWKLYDMHGNVWEWCQDWYEDDLGSFAVTNPSGPSDDSQTSNIKVLRGGSFNYRAVYCRSATRVGGPPGESGSATGFRLVVSPP